MSKLRAGGLAERIGNSQRYRLTPLGLRLGVLLVKLRMRLLGLLATLIHQPHTNAKPQRPNSVDPAYREIDIALDHVSAALGVQQAAQTTSALHLLKMPNCVQVGVPLTRLSFTVSAQPQNRPRFHVATGVHC